MTGALRIHGGAVLVGDALVETAVDTDGGHIAAIGAESGNGPLASMRAGSYVLPGIVDIHGDAFERQLMPRPGVRFATAHRPQGQRPPGDRQRHHHRVPWRHRFVGAGAAQHRHRARNSGRGRGASRRSCRRHAAASALRGVQSRRRSRESRIGSPSRRIDMLGFNDHMSGRTRRRACARSRRWRSGPGVCGRGIHGAGRAPARARRRGAAGDRASRARAHA